MGSGRYGGTEMTGTEKHFETLRSMSRYENDLINHRLGVLAVFQGLLFVALAFAWDKNHGFVLAVVISLIGLFVSISIGWATKKANEAISNLQIRFDEIKPTDYVGADIEGSRSGSGKLDWVLPGTFIPWVFAGGWLLIIIVNLVK